jgi:hypothetical protein
MKRLELDPIEMTPDIMALLEEKGLIIRLYPKKYALDVEDGSTKTEVLYETDPKFGSHMLIVVAVNRKDFKFFGWHEDNEDIFLIGDPNSKPMYLVIALCDQQCLQNKIQEGTLSSDDFVSLIVKYNDPDVSFFTMKKNIPHGELIKEDGRNIPTFYVTEPNDMKLIIADLQPYELVIK